MNKKIGIVTILDRNYGNRLQNYALQKAVKQLGYKVVTVDTEKKTKFAFIKNKIKSLLLQMKYNKSQPFWVWEVFDFQYIDKVYVSMHDLSEKLSGLYRIIVGSDQVWNPILYYFKPDYVFLEFAESEQKIAYAASIGITSVPEEWIARFKMGLTDFRAISMREEEGANALKGILKKNIPVVLDPTMLITEKEWSNLSQKSNIRKKKKYILKYYLGEKSDCVDAAILKYANSNACEIVDLTKELKDIGPKEFLWLIQNCEMMFTDSFHGSVFSILFHKKFWIFERPIQNDTGEMNSRLYTLANHFDIKDRLLKSDYTIQQVDFEKEIDYRKIDILLESKRRESFEYLKAVLD